MVGQYVQFARSDRTVLRGFGLCGSLSIAICGAALARFIGGGSSVRFGLLFFLVLRTVTNEWCVISICA